MNFVEEMKKKAKDYQNSLVLPEGTEERTVQAAAKIVALGGGLTEKEADTALHVTPFEATKNL